MKDHKTKFHKDIKLSKNIIIVGIFVFMVSISPLYRNETLTKQIDLSYVEDVLVSKEIYHGRKRHLELILTLKNYPKKFHVSDLAFKEACKNCLDLSINDSVFIGIKKENIFNKIGKPINVFSLRNKQNVFLP